MILPRFFAVSVAILTVGLAFASNPPKPNKPDTDDNNTPPGGAAEFQAYLRRYGYLPSASSGHSSIMTSEAMRRATMNFQRFAAINQTGVIDEATIEMMNTPRCQVMDPAGDEGATRRRRYVLQGSRWGKTYLTYRISTYTKDMSKAEVDNEIKRAFQLWSEVTPLQFQQIQYGRPDIEILFANRSHGDGSPFDGAGGALAHAYFPNYGGDAHFDDGERWTLRTYQGKNLFQVAAHEIGHSLGLSHSAVRRSVMWAFYSGYKPDFPLDSDDTDAIQILYGNNPNRPNPQETTTTTATTTRRSNPGVTTTTARPPGGVPDLCQDAKIDAVTRTADGKTYFFKGAYYWLWQWGESITAGYPRLISQNWAGVPGQVDAALTYSREHSQYTFLFRGRQYWKFYNQRLLAGYPRLIKDGFPGIPDHLSAALLWSGNGKVYFFKGEKYYRYTPRLGTDWGYPREVAIVWKGLPSTIEGAFQWQNGRTYFFKGDQYYRFNDRLIRVDDDYPITTTAWFKYMCQNNGRIQDGGMKDEMEAKNQWIMVGANETATTTASVNTTRGENEAPGGSSSSLFISWVVLAFAVILPSM